MSKYEWDTGLRTTKFMWQLVSELVENKKLPDLMKEALHKLRDGEVEIVEKRDE